MAPQDPMGALGGVSFPEMLSAPLMSRRCLFLPRVEDLGVAGHGHALGTQAHGCECRVSRWLDQAISGEPGNRQLALQGWALASLQEESCRGDPRAEPLGSSWEALSGVGQRGHLHKLPEGKTLSKSSPPPAG